MWRMNLIIDSHQYHDTQASSPSLNHFIRCKEAPGRETRSGVWSEHRQWIALQFLTAERITGKLHQNQPLMNLYREQSGHDVNSLYLLTNQVNLIYPSQLLTMHGSNFTSCRVPFGNRKCRSRRRQKWMDSWHENPISYKTDRFIKSVLQYNFRCERLKRLLQQNEGNFRCARMEPDKWQPNRQMLLGRGRKSDWSAISIRWHLWNVNFSINFSNIMSDNHCKNYGLKWSVPEEHLPKNLLKWRLLQKRRFKGW